MPDNNGDQPTDMNVKNIHATGIQTESLNTNRQTVANMTVTRLDVATGEEKDASSDVMNELRIATERDNRTIINLLDKNLKQLKAEAKDVGNYTDSIAKTIEDLSNVTGMGYSYPNPSI